MGLARILLHTGQEETKMEKMTRADARARAREMRKYGWRAKTQRMQDDDGVYWIIAAKTLTMAKGADWLYLREDGRVA